MKSFFQDRGHWLAEILLIMFAVSLAQASISYTMAFGALRDFLPNERSLLATVLVALRFGLVAVLAVLWMLKRRHVLFRFIIATNALFTLALLVHMNGL